jgi:hypothetical protein
MVNETKNTTAQDLKIGSTFRKDGCLHCVIEITNEEYMNGNPSLMVECESTHKIYGKDKTVYHFKPTTKLQQTGL